jgi:hypothetical protein
VNGVSDRFLLQGEEVAGGARVLASFGRAPGWSMCYRTEQIKGSGEARVQGGEDRDQGRAAG